MIDREVNAVVLWLSSFKTKKKKTKSRLRLFRKYCTSGITWDSDALHYVRRTEQRGGPAHQSPSHRRVVYANLIYHQRLSLSLWGTLLLLLPLQDWNRTWDKIKTDRGGGEEGIQIVGWFWILLLLLGRPHLNHSRVGCAPIVSIICQIRPCPISIIPPLSTPSVSKFKNSFAQYIHMGPLHFTILCTNYVLLTLVRV